MARLISPITHLASVAVVVTVLVGLAACATVSGNPESRGYQLVYHKPGTLKQEYVPGGPGGQKGGYKTFSQSGLSIFTGNGLTYFSEQGQVTIYKPQEGLFVHVPVDYGEKQRADPDGTREVAFGRPPRGFSSRTCSVLGLRRASSIQIWDDAPSHPERWDQTYSFNAERQDRHGAIGVPTLGMGSSYDQEDVRVTPDGRASYFSLCEVYLQTATATSLPKIAAARDDAAHAGERAAKQASLEAVTARKNAEQRSALTQQGQDGFARAVATQKQIGLTVCSSDNRVAYIEQVAGDRIKLSIRGRAIGNYKEFGQYGPRSIASPPTPFDPSQEPRAIEDPNFLFLPLEKPVRLSKEPQTIWDESRYWGLCDYR